jgi:uncharacterized protein (DUF1697 family)
MPTYAALIRGVGPTNPNTRNDKLAAVLKTVGCTAIKPILASGNFVFQSTARSATQLETKIEKAFREKLGVTSDVIVLRQDELEALIQSDPFKGAEHGAKWYLTVTFRKDRQPPIFSKLDRTKMDGPEFMADLERRYGKHITTRTWNTLMKILAASAS